jgi:hypothetical protein
VRQAAFWPAWLGVVPDVHRSRGIAFAGPVQADGLTAGVVIEADALAEQDRCDVQVDLVDQPLFKELTADGRREHFEVLAAGRLQPDPPEGR